MIYYLLLIIVLTLIFWGLYKARIIPICPICAGVVITWASGILALYYGASWANSLIIGILMGASMGAIVDRYGNEFGLFWKSTVIVLGLPAIYFIVQKFLWQGTALIALLIILSIILKSKSKALNNNKKDLFKDCC